MGFVDTSPSRLQRACRTWGGTAYKSLSIAFREPKPDVVVVATPDNTHYPVLNQITGHQFKLVIMEKPLSVDLKQARAIRRWAKRRCIPLLVNYNRRFVPEFRRLAEIIHQEEYGRFLTGTTHYGKGLLHNGSHFIDLLIWFFGRIKPHRKFFLFKDYSPNDPSIAGELLVKNRPLFFLPVHSRLATIFEIDLFFSRGRISILNSGETVREYRVLPHRIFRTIHTFQTSRSYKTSLFQSQYHMADTAYKYLLGKAELPINIDEAVENIGICEKITHMDFYK